MDNNNSIRLTVKNFNFYYGKFQALKNINMEVEKNKTTALIGPSGCILCAVLVSFL